MFCPAAFWTHDVVVSLAMTLPAMETVSKMKTIDRRRTIRTVADLRRNKLRVAIFEVSLDLEKGLLLDPAVNP
jgi:hypothetical protein